jgi:cytochrome c oxidase cbb3-type subunit III
MSEGDRDRLLPHAQDGIQEYDNPLPGWWVWIFWATILFSIGYWVYYELGPGPSVVAQYEAEMKAAATRQPASVAGAFTDASLAALEKDASAMAKAKGMFATRCSPCHGDRGQGIVGPNLTDEYWLHGGRLSEIYHTISEGVPEKGMIPWKDQLSPADIASLAAFIGTLRDSHPPNPKPHEGVKVHADGSPEHED